MSQPLHVAAIVGSLRKDSINRKLAKAIEAAAGERARFSYPDIGDLGLYCQDLESDWPANWQRFKEAIEAADAVLFVTPEYNRSYPGVLKNAIDIASRPWGKNSFAGKPGAVLGASISNTRSAMAQQHLRNVVSYLDVRVMPQPEAYVQTGMDGNWDAATDDFIGVYTNALLAWIEAQRKAG